MTAGQARFPIAPSHWQFAQQGKSGRYVSELLPWSGKLVDDITLIHTMQTDAINHEPAILLMNTGNMNPGKPSLGSWLAYGLGSMNENLPTYVVLNSTTMPGTDLQPISPKLWSSGFLSSEYAGVAFRTKGAPVLYLEDPSGMSRNVRRELIDAVNSINQMTFEELGDPETNARINQYEMAFRMQTSLPELTDFRDEPASTWTLYGDEAKQEGSFAYNCLLARRMAERGVRFTQVYQRGWDVHSNAVGNTPKLSHRNGSRIVRARDRPQTSRPSRRYARHLGWRIRPHRLQSGRTFQRKLRTRPSSSLLHDMDGRRRNERRLRARRDGRFLL